MPIMGFTLATSSGTLVTRIITIMASSMVTIQLEHPLIHPPVTRLIRLIPPMP